MVRRSLIYLEPVLKPGLLPGDETAGQMHEGEMIGGLPFPTNEEPSEAIMPAVRTLDHPASGLALDSANERRLAATTDVGDDTPLAYRPVDVSIVITFVQAEMARATGAARPLEHDRIEHRRGQPLVMPIGRCDQGRERDPAPVREEMALRAPLASVGRIRPRVSPPLGALTVTLSSAAQRH